jgi:hypothetical protein
MYSVSISAAGWGTKRKPAGTADATHDTFDRLSAEP